MTATEGQEKKWRRMRFKKNKVWVALGPDGDPEVKEGKVLVKYQLKQNYEYWVLKRNIQPMDNPEPDRTARAESDAPQKGKGTPKDRSRAGTDKDALTPDEAVCIYTDGASSGNPGPSGIGILLRYKGKEKTISKYIGEATNNIAELEAIRVGLLAVKNRDVPVRVFTDSKYAYGLLTLGWQPKKNQELVASILALVEEFKDLKLIKVKGHAGHAENETADRLAVAAVQAGA